MKRKAGTALIITAMVLPAVALIFFFLEPNPNIGISIGVLIRVGVGALFAGLYGRKLRRDAEVEEFEKKVKELYGEDAQLIYR